MVSKIKILFEDSNILAIEKPAGILVHSDQKTGEKTILDLFVKKYPKVEVVHRLDRDTSGVMLLAKNSKAHEFLKKQFSAPALELKTKGVLVNRQARIKKVYVAIVSGFVKLDHGTINKPIGRSPVDFRRHSASRGARGEMREAITEYKVLKRFEVEPHKIFSRSSLSRVRDGSHTDKKSHEAQLNKFTYLEVKPKTGRTHQIRVHMKYLNHPVVCDALYDPEGFCPKGLSRMALHAHSIEFTDMKGKTVKVESPIPLEIRKVVQ